MRGRKFFAVAISVYFVLVMLGALVAYLWIDDSEFLDPFSTSAWCESVIKMQTDASTISFVWNCYDPGQFWTWAFALGTFFALIGAGLGLAIWAATTFLMRLLRLDR